MEAAVNAYAGGESGAGSGRAPNEVLHACARGAIAAMAADHFLYGVVLSDRRPPPGR